MKFGLLLSALFVLNIGCQSLTTTNKSKEKTQSKKKWFNPSQTIIKTGLTAKPSGREDRFPALSQGNELELYWSGLRIEGISWTEVLVETINLFKTKYC